MLEINAVFVKSTQEILYSRSRHDYRTSEDNSVSVDGGFDYFKWSGDIANIVNIELDPFILLQQILHADYSFKNSTASEYPNGYHGRYKITKGSNMGYFKSLITNWADIEPFITRE